MLWERKRPDARTSVAGLGCATIPLVNLVDKPLGARWREQFGANGSIYCRVTLRVVEDGLGLRTLDLADINLPEDERGKGLFRALLGGLEAQLATFPALDALFVENVINERLARFLRRRGWREDWRQPQCFYFKRPGMVERPLAVRR